ncbi:MAG: FAD-dependent oxidoreductase [Sulfurovaceae bacterium]|nr:FAD-dependent oxidoreductase [Sulfurovaceae bacterium]
MKRALIGHTGFVGNFLLNKLSFDNLYNSKNINDIRGQEFDLIICCGISAKKWEANKNPEKDLENINLLLSCLEDVKCARFILISSIDVYPNIDSEYTEDYLLTGDEQNHAYGKHRLFFEKYVKGKFKNHNIIRFPGLFGYGLKKNIIFDLLNNKLCALNLKSKYQWYDLNWIFNDIDYVIDKNIKEINLFTEPISNQELINTITQIKNDINYSESEVIVEYNTKTKFGIDGYWRTKGAVLGALKYFIKSTYQNNLVVSSLSFKGELNYKSLDEFAIKNIEIAPSKFFGENFISQPLDYFDKWKNCGIYSIQSLLYPHKNNIFSDEQWFINYIEKIAAIAGHIGAKVLVFGSPKNRTVSDTYNYDYAVELFRKIGVICEKHNVIFCIENNATSYGCNFLTTSDQVIDFVKEVNHNHIKAVLDVGCAFLENEDIYNKLVEYAKTEWVYHVHISAPNLVSIALFKDVRYKYLYDTFSKVYKNKITLELSNQEDMEIKRSIYTLKKLPSIAIIGSGWYGAHIGVKMLEKGCSVLIYEKNNEIFNGASSFNQNRLHLGFHYPRSSDTRKLCREGYDKFIKEYGFCVHDIKNNIYLIAKESLVDYKTYLGIYNYEEINYRQCESLNEFNNIQGGICVDEKFIDPLVAKHYFSKKLANVIRLGKNISNVYELSLGFDYVYDCTYNALGLMSDFNNYNVIYELTLSLLYKSNITDTAYTIMDGEFGSVYPYDIHNDLFSLTSVKYTPLIKTQNYNDINNYVVDENHIYHLRDLMEADIIKYIPSFTRDFKYHSFFVSYKCKINNPSDSRELVTKQTINIHTVVCGKITGIFELDDSLL